MPQARGRKAQLLLDYETTFGQDPATPVGIKMPFNTCGLRGVRNLIDDTVIRNTRNPAQPSRGNQNVEGDIVVPVDVIGIGYWLRAMFGAPTTTGTGPYTHTFKPGDLQPSLVLAKEFTDIGQYLKYNGCKVSKMAVTFGGDGELTATFTIMGAKETIGVSSYDTTPTEITLTKFSHFQATIQEGGLACAIGTEVRLEVDFDLDGDQYVIGGGGIRGDIPEGMVKPSGSITALFQDATLLNKAVNGTESSLKVTLTSGTNSLEIFIPELIYEQQSPGIEGPRGIRIQLPFRGYYGDSTEAAVIQVKLSNSQPTY